MGPKRTAPQETHQQKSLMEGWFGKLVAGLLVAVATQYLVERSSLAPSSNTKAKTVVEERAEWLAQSIIVPRVPKQGVPRQALLDEARDWYEMSNKRILELVGPRGAGKSTLASQFLALHRIPELMLNVTLDGVVVDMQGEYVLVNSGMIYDAMKTFAQQRAKNATNPSLVLRFEVDHLATDANVVASCEMMKKLTYDWDDDLDLRGVFVASDQYKIGSCDPTRTYTLNVGSMLANEAKGLLTLWNVSSTLHDRIITVLGSRPTDLIAAAGKKNFNNAALDRYFEFARHEACTAIQISKFKQMEGLNETMSRLAEHGWAPMAPEAVQSVRWAYFDYQNAVVVARTPLHRGVMAVMLKSPNLLCAQLLENGKFKDDYQA